VLAVTRFSMSVQSSLELIESPDPGFLGELETFLVASADVLLKDLLEQHDYRQVKPLHQLGKNGTVAGRSDRVRL